MAKTLKQGTKVKFFYNSRHRTGKIHGVRQVEDDKGNVTELTYLVDTGKEHEGLVGEPELIEISPDDIES